MTNQFHINPIGIINKQNDHIYIEIYTEYEPALLGVEEFSHIHVFYWFHDNDTPENRSILQVHPRKNPENPLTGVFATHSPVRPNLIALTRCKVIAVDGCRIQIEDIDARDGSPVIDLKCYIPHEDKDLDVRLPDWV